MPNGYVKPTVGCPGLLLRRKVWGGRSKLGSNHLEKLGPSSGYKPHHRQTDGQKCQYTSLLSQLQQNLLNMQMFPPALGPLCMSPGSLLSPPPGKKKKNLFLALPSPQLARQRLPRSHPPQTVFVSELWVRMFTQTPHGIIYLEGCQLEKC